MEPFRFLALLALIGVASAFEVHTTEDGTGHSDERIGFAGVAPSSSTVSNAVASASPTAALAASPKPTQQKQLTTSSAQGMFVTGFGVAVVAAFM
ncbi:hypothetical protein HDU79_004163 [Rhizoclosmatium sp. JEL0117]|nr:hypothetical protein HDU79_004163 [Rhizoclosmatium sp. JEL0117]